jgi:AcrR family transcriptional regulator
VPAPAGWFAADPARERYTRVPPGPDARADHCRSRPLFLKHGIDNTPVAEICRLAGVSNGALFHQYPVKEDIAFAVYTQVRSEFWDRVVGAMVAESDPLDGVEAAVRAAFAFQREEPDAAAFMFDVTGSTWLENYAQAAQPLYEAGTQRGMAWALPHIQAGRLPPVAIDAYVALVSGAPQWIGRLYRVGMASAPIETIAEDLAKMVRRAFTVS